MYIDWSKWLALHSPPRSCWRYFVEYPVPYLFPQRLSYALCSTVHTAYNKPDKYFYCFLFHNKSHNIFVIHLMLYLYLHRNFPPTLPSNDTRTRHKPVPSLVTPKIYMTLLKKGQNTRFFCRPVFFKQSNPEPYTTKELGNIIKQFFMFGSTKSWFCTFTECMRYWSPSILHNPSSVWIDDWGKKNKWKFNTRAWYSWFCI